MPRSASDPLPGVARPAGGYLRELRTSLGLSLQTVADRLEVSPQAVHQFEKSEVAGTISLRQFNAVARAMGHRIVYRVEPVRAPRRKPAEPAQTRAQPEREVIAAPAPTPPAAEKPLDQPVSLDWFAVTTD